METTKATISSPVSYVIADFKVLFIAGKHHDMHQAITMCLSLRLSGSQNCRRPRASEAHAIVTRSCTLLHFFPIIKHNIFVHKSEHLFLPLYPPFPVPHVGSISFQTFFFTCTQTHVFLFKKMMSKYTCIV